MPIRLGLVMWLCLGALGLGLVLLEASRSGKSVPGKIYAMAMLLGPIFLCVVVPVWLGKWGKKK